MNRSLDRRSFLASAITAGAGAYSLGLEAAVARSDSDRSLERGVGWLIDQQSDDGGWHSAAYGAMRGGVGNTGLILNALSQLPAVMKRGRQQPLDKGVRFLLAQLEHPKNADYPTYAAALLLSAPSRENAVSWIGEQEKLRNYLLSQQRESCTVRETSGGWGATHGEGTNDANISVTRFVLEAIGPGLDDDTRQAALAFVERCQNYGDGRDGGFFFTPHPDDPMNKAGGATSYGSATADGLLALLACDCEPDHPRVKAAMYWLDRHDKLHAVPEIPTGGHETSELSEGLRFYYYAALATAMEKLPRAPFADRRERLVREIHAMQRHNGSWQNESTAMKEDDPLIATALAVMALAKHVKV